MFGEGPVVGFIPRGDSSSGIGSRKSKCCTELVGDVCGVAASLDGAGGTCRSLGDSWGGSDGMLPSGDSSTAGVGRGNGTAALLLHISFVPWRDY